MKKKPTKKEMELLLYVNRFKILTIAQLAALTNRRKQVVRRGAKSLSDKGLLQSNKQSYTNHKGRPEDIIQVTESG